MTLTPPLNRGVEADYMIIIQLERIGSIAIFMSAARSRFVRSLDHLVRALRTIATVARGGSNWRAFDSSVGYGILGDI